MLSILHKMMNKLIKQTLKVGVECSSECHVMTSDSGKEFQISHSNLMPYLDRFSVFLSQKQFHFVL